MRPCSKSIRAFEAQNGLFPSNVDCRAAASVPAERTERSEGSCTCPAFSAKVFIYRNRSNLFACIFGKVIIEFFFLRSRCASNYSTRNLLTSGRNEKANGIFSVSFDSLPFIERRFNSAAQEKERKTFDVPADLPLPEQIKFEINKRKARVAGLPRPRIPRQKAEEEEDRREKVFFISLSENVFADRLNWLQQKGKLGKCERKE